jgi:hypothetical protein
MAARNSVLGTLTIKEGSKTTTFPVLGADFGVNQYTDKYEIYFEVQAGNAISNNSVLSAEEEVYHPRLYLTVYEDHLNLEDFSGLKFSIGAPFEELMASHPDAFLHWYADYGEPETLGPCMIEIGEKEDDIYPVHCQATLDYFSGTKPGSEIEFEVNAEFTLNRIKAIPCTFRYADQRPFDKWMFILLPTCGTAGYVASKYTNWLNWWGGILVGLFVATWIAQKIDLRWQMRVHQLKFGGTPAGETISENSADVDR